MEAPLSTASEQLWVSICRSQSSELRLPACEGGPPTLVALLIQIDHPTRHARELLREFSVPLIFLLNLEDKQTSL